MPKIAAMTPEIRAAGPTDGQAARFQVAFEDDPYSNEALDRTDEMRDALAALEGQG